MLSSHTTLRELRLNDGSVQAVYLPRKIVQAIIDKSNRHLHYRGGGDWQLREAFCEAFLQSSGFCPPPSQTVVVRGGCSEAIDVAVDYAVPPRGVVSYFTPAWPGYKLLTEERSLIDIPLPGSRMNRYLPSLAALRLLATEKIPISAIFLTHYATPFGSAMSERYVRELGEEILRLPGKPVVIEDCLFWQNRPGNQRLPTLARIVPELWHEERLVGVTSLGKAWPLGAWDVGFAWGPRSFFNHFIGNYLHQQIQPELRLQFGLRQALSAEGLQTPKAVNAAVRENLAAVCELTRDSLFGLASLPDGGINALVDVHDLIDLNFRGQTISSDIRLARLLKEHFKLLVTPGYELQCRAPQVRLNLAGAKPQHFLEAMDRMRAFSEECFYN